MRHARDAHPIRHASIHVVIYPCTNRMTHIGKGKAMHAETDQATYYVTMARITGHSRRYLVVRTWVRAAVATVPLLSAAVAYLLTK